MALNCGRKAPNEHAAVNITLCVGVARSCRNSTVSEWRACCVVGSEFTKIFLQSYKRMTFIRVRDIRVPIRCGPAGHRAQAMERGRRKMTATDIVSFCHYTSR